MVSRGSTSFGPVRCLADSLGPGGGGVQMGRTGNAIVLIVYLLTIPAGVFFYFTSPGMGYPKSTAGIIAGVLALVGLALIPVAIRNRPADPEAPAEGLSAKTG